MEPTNNNILMHEVLPQNTEAALNKPVSIEAAPNNRPPMGNMAPMMPMPPVKKPTELTLKLRENFGSFAPATALYACFYTFCMHKNGSGITFALFIAATVWFLSFTLQKLELTFQKGSLFYTVSMMLLGVSTFCTDDGRIIFFNKLGILLLVLSLLLNQFYNTEKWALGKYVASIFRLLFCSIEELCSPFSDGAAYVKSGKGKGNKNLWYALLGCLLAVPMVVIVVALLSGADAVFRQLTDTLLKGIRLDNLFFIVVRTVFLFFAAYLLTAYLCKKTIPEDVKDCRTGEPVLAVTFTGILTVIYVLFSGIQIFGLFLGKLQLPAGYTYARYAREGFFQLLAVSILNLIIVLVCMSLFRESRILKVVLTLMSLCTFIMIASSAMRMLIYIHYYSLTFLRILVLWTLALLFLLFGGVILNIYRNRFPLFRYSMTVVTVLYLALSFSHPDFIIARVNVTSTSTVCDYAYLGRLSADAAPVLIPYLSEQNLTMDWEEDGLNWGRSYINRLRYRTDDFGVRTYNVSRHMALEQMKLLRDE